MTLSKAAPILLAGMAAALPQGSPAPTESPTGLDCSWHLDHWDCAAPCSTVTNTRLAIDATITDYPSWLESMNLAHSTSGVPFSGTRVFVHTSVYEYPGGSFTGYGVYDSHGLTRAGYSVIEEEVVTTTITGTVIPSRLLDQSRLLRASVPPMTTTGIVPLGFLSPLNFRDKSLAMMRSVPLMTIIGIARLVCRSRLSLLAATPGLPVAPPQPPL
ncbi:hypothetical protein B0T11DRAFT_327307 [Plectosphaerella cucumerina]|uniref:Uncharacterized protein n=1 Tax=Plectosphaerella cucumerina TaxID=40658 RepID=A0A8K0TKK1_9PEZI|nr:hypothetical protein B0T11DRAFT_327307 [Plectosphaerella cucumerina]